MRQLLASILFVALMVVASSAQNQATTNFSNSRYENSQLGLSISMPDSWQAASAEALDRAREGTTDPGHVDVFVAIESKEGTPADKQVVVVMGEKLDQVSGTSIELGKQYADKALRKPKVSSVGKPVRILLGGIEFYRIDLKERTKMQENYLAVMANGQKGLSRSDKDLWRFSARRG